MDPTVSPQSCPWRQGREPEQQPRKKVRGRPLKSSDNSSVPEERRAQIRRAQEAFRLRKLAATKSLEDRIKSLEACVQDMSTTFIDLSDFLIRSVALQQDPDVARKLVAATSKFIALAKGVMDESNDAAAAADDEAQSIPMSSDRDTVTGPKSWNSSSTVCERTTSSPVREQRFPLLEESKPMQATLLKEEVFGNGWFGLQPEVLSKLSPVKHGASGKLESSFGVKLLQTTLSIAYEYLMDQSGSRYDTIMHMYGFALMYHTKQELLFNARWFLGPGICALRALGSAVFGYSSSLSLQYLNAISSGAKPKILNPMVDALALVEAQKKYPIIQYLNAYDVEDYIISKGAFHIDQDIIRLRVPDSQLLSPKCSPHDTSQNIDWAAIPEKTPSYLSNGSAILAIAEDPSSSSHFPVESGTLSHLPSDHILDDGWIGQMNFDSDKQARHASTKTAPRIMEQNIPKRNHIRTLSVPVLLQNLAQRAQCLGTGPGYPTSTVDLAIELSTMEFSGY